MSISEGMKVTVLVACLGLAVCWPTVTSIGVGEGQSAELEPVWACVADDDTNCILQEGEREFVWEDGERTAIGADKWAFWGEDEALYILPEAMLP